MFPLPQAELVKQKKELEEEVARLREELETAAGTVTEPSQPPPLTLEVVRLQAAVETAQGEAANAKSQLLLILSQLEQAQQDAEFARAELQRVTLRANEMTEASAREAVIASLAQAELRRQMEGERREAEAWRVKCDELAVEVGRLSLALAQQQQQAFAQQQHAQQQQAPPVPSLMPALPVTQHSFDPYRPTVLTIASPVPSSSSLFPSAPPSVRARSQASVGFPSPFPTQEEEGEEEGEGKVRAPLLHSDLLLKRCMHDPVRFAKTQAGMALTYLLFVHVLLAFLIRRCAAAP